MKRISKADGIGHNGEDKQIYSSITIEALVPVLVTIDFRVCLLQSKDIMQTASIVFSTRHLTKQVPAWVIHISKCYKSTCK